MTKWNKAIQCEQIWWLRIAYTVKLITSTSTYQCSFPCVDHSGITRESRDLAFPANSLQWSIRRQKYQLSKSLMNFLMGSMCLLICQRQKLWQSSPRKHRKNIHRTSIIPEINYKRFREGAALHLFLIFSRVEIKVNGLISDWCRSFFSSIK